MLPAHLAENIRKQVLFYPKTPKPLVSQAEFLAIDNHIKLSQSKSEAVCRVDFCFDEIDSGTGYRLFCFSALRP